MPRTAPGPVCPPAFPQALLPRAGNGRVLLVLFVLLGVAAQALLTATSLPDESPRAAILRLTGLDIAPAAMQAMETTGEQDAAPATTRPGGMAQDTACSHEHATMTGGMKADSTPHADTAHGASHHHHHGLDCPLCPLLGHILFILACLPVLLGHARLSRKPWQALPPAQAPPDPACPRPPCRGPPAILLFQAA